MSAQGYYIELISECCIMRWLVVVISTFNLLQSWDNGISSDEENESTVIIYMYLVSFFIKPESKCSLDRSGWLIFHTRYYN